MRMSPPRIVFSLFALAGALALGACSKAPSAAGGAPGAVEVGVVRLVAQDATLVRELPGRTHAYQTAEIRPQVSGIVLKREFTEGGQVQAGQALYQIDPASFTAALASARASLARAEANFAASSAKAKRYGDLLKKKSISQQDFDDAQASFKQAQADVLAAKAQVQTAQINLNYTKVAAPISGQISKSSVTAGALVTANQANSLATIAQLDPIYVDLTQSSAELLKLRQALAAGLLSQAGEQQAIVNLSLEDGSQYAHSGTLQFSEVTVDPATGSVTLRALFPNPDQLLLPGMYVRARITEGVRSNAILAPQRGVTRNARGQATAMVVNSDNLVEARILKTERTLGSDWVVDEGLQVGDQIIVDGLQRVRPGAAVKAVPFQDNANPQSHQ